MTGMKRPQGRPRAKNPLKHTVFFRVNQETLDAIERAGGSRFIRDAVVERLRRRKLLSI